MSTIGKLYMNQLYVVERKLRKEKKILKEVAFKQAYLTKEPNPTL